MNERSRNTAKVVAAALLLILAALGFARFFSNNNGVSEKTFFYDLSEKKLFATSREALPPIRGLNDPEEDAVRAIVISRGNPEDKSTHTIAYLEKYAPELKHNLDEVRAGKAEPLPSKVRNGYRFVKRVEDGEWQRVDTPQGQAILNGWNVAGPDGKYPAVCVP
jgi:hypothetical protein